MWRSCGWGLITRFCSPPHLSARTAQQIAARARDVMIVCDPLRILFNECWLITIG